MKDLPAGATGSLELGAGAASVLLAGGTCVGVPA